MPGFDGTGPYGSRDWICRRGFGFGRGMRAGRGLGFRQWPQSNNEIGLSKEEQRKILEAEKQEIEKRLEELK